MKRSELEALSLKTLRNTTVMTPPLVTVDRNNMMVKKYVYGIKTLLLHHSIFLLQTAPKKQCFTVSHMLRLPETSF